MSEDHRLPEDYPGLLRAWLAFVRPKTWGVAVAPVLATLALAYSERHVFDPVVAFFTLSIAVLMQIVTNMENDLGYTERKAEVGNRKGLPRATTRGWISRSTARRAIVVTGVLALLNTGVLIAFGGWPFALVGGGPKPIAYTPFGELTVLLFFGITAVFGTYYLQTHAWSLNMVLLGIALGSIAASVLAVNNYRDHEHDRSIGRKTLAVVLPEEVFVKVFEVLIVAPYLLVALMVVIDMSYWPYFLVMLSFVDCMRLPEKLRTLKHEALNAVMFSCVKLEIKFSVLFMLGALAQALLMHLTVSAP